VSEKSPPESTLAPTILASALVNAHALSFGHQPILKDLIADLQKADHPLLVVAGAGVSIDAGLHSWADLLQAIEAKEAPELAEALRVLQSDSIQRRGTIAISLAARNRPLGPEYETIRDALFSGPVPEPGDLAAAIARLVKVYGNDVRVATTNYDPLLEYALGGNAGQEEGRSFSLHGRLPSSGGPTSGADMSLDFNAWQSLPAEEARNSVMHLHGMVPVSQDDPALGPFVLTEDSFLRYGAEVSESLAEAMRGRTVLLVGLSMTDPDILAALRICREKEYCGRRYAITVPSLYRDDLGLSKLADYHCIVAATLRTRFSVLPILLKTHSQTIQLISELALASRLGKRYSTVKGKPGSSMRYGARMDKTLRNLYGAVGYTARSAREREDRLRVVSREMNRLMRARNGPADYLSTMSRKYLGTVAKNENIALFLWLRDIDDFKSKDGSSADSEAGFRLRLIVSSAYHHWESWSAYRAEDVTGSSRYAPVQALFQGQPSTTNFEFGENSGNWHAAYAIPLRVVETSSYEAVAADPLDQLLVGAVAVNTTAFIVQDEIAAQGSEKPSVLGVMAPSELREFNYSLLETVETAFNVV
jgi:hypothetical protein